MAVYTFRCSKCSVVLEALMPMATATFEDRPCPACGGACVHQLQGAPSLGTEGMSNAAFDVKVGADAERRWARIRARQEKRDKVRQEAGARPLSATTHEDWRAVPGARLRGLEIPPKAQDTIVIPVGAGQEN
jgi:putative FmdB family regulatory protein